MFRLILLYIPKNAEILAFTLEIHQLNFGELCENLKNYNKLDAAKHVIASISHQNKLEIWIDCEKLLGFSVEASQVMRIGGALEIIFLPYLYKYIDFITIDK